MDIEQFEDELVEAMKDSVRGRDLLSLNNQHCPLTLVANKKLGLKFGIMEYVSAGRILGLSEEAISIIAFSASKSGRSNQIYLDYHKRLFSLCGMGERA